MNLPRLTIEVLAWSEADQRNAGWVIMPARPCAAGKVPIAKLVLLPGAPPENVAPGYSVARRLLKYTLVDVTRSSIVPLFVHSTSVTNFCVDVRRSVVNA